MADSAGIKSEFGAHGLREERGNYYPLPKNCSTSQPAHGAFAFAPCSFQLASFFSFPSLNKNERPVPTDRRF
ncbi:hypothetical protein HETIRDRAFT_441128 [Heterobasidion irregulare TC 32-1]|uniref:Uncharacterized protein n=1 Tax=Heterobasidion irregulare (strain TC 32-1) TaxID=747525 RepID=W4JZS9_HETIT|nr:uncharacterized protein HETIRDRAFT_441128 [Heterobasidion irregulare TC 32-1]ETW78984.1 hypothetical protein HETIRDRAFT_441128 [Heterobasidion irregulare TC 32-1]